MEMQTGRQLELLDAEERALGLITLEERQGDLLLGRFAPGPDFPAVGPLFRKFEEAVNAQALSAADRCEAAIGALGLCLREAGGGKKADVKDVQIWSDGDMTCRLSIPAGGASNANTRAGAAVVRVPNS